MKKLLLLCVLTVLSCARDVAICDAATHALKKRIAIAECKKRGYKWLACPERPRLLAEFEKELNQCSQP